MNPHRDIEEEVSVFEEEEVRSLDEAHFKKHPELFNQVTGGNVRSLRVLHLIGQRRTNLPSQMGWVWPASPFEYEEGYAEYFDATWPFGTIPLVFRWRNYGAEVRDGANELALDNDFDDDEWLA